MKKLAVILAMLLIVPGTAFGLEMMNDSAMDEVTGQSGVAIVFDDVEMFMHIDEMAWLDTGGFDTEQYYGGSTVTTAGDDGEGAIAIENFQIDTLRVNAIVDQSNGGNDTGNDLLSASASQIELQYEYATAGGQGTSAAAGTETLGGSYGTIDYGLENYTNAAGGNGNFTAKALTIDATSKLPVTSEAFTLNIYGSTDGTNEVNVGGVLIGLPTAEINIPELVFTPTFKDISADYGTSVQSANHGADYGTIYMEGITMTVLNGWLEISPLTN